VALLVVVTAPPDTSSGAAHRDPNDAAGPLDLALVGIDQSGPEMKLLARTRGRWNASALDDHPDLTADRPQNYLCLDLRQSGVLHRACVGKDEGKRAHLTLLRINDNGQVASSRRLRHVTVRRPSARSVKAIGRIRDLKLDLGRLGWRWRSGWGEGACAPAQPPPPLPLPLNSGDREARQAPEPTECKDSHPDNRFARARVRRPRIVGCTRDEDLVNAHGSRKRKRVALTFDDGPSSYTDNVLDILENHRVKSTFYVLGEAVGGRASLLRRMIRNRHEIGNHTMHHSAYPGPADLAATNDRIKRASGFRPCTFRPPYGAMDSTTARGAWRQGMSTILWDVDTNDWRRPGSGAIYARAVGSARPGSIVLMHDGGGDRSQTVAALPSIIKNLKNRGYGLVTVTRLLRERVIWWP
jgi:peptidoglycan/xylan/chitin deacetylase (PgdA/CDA1 family)